MHDLIYFNGQIQPAGDAFLPAVSSAALYGKGIFTTIAVSGGKPFLWEKHWRRLQSQAAKINVDLSEFSESRVRDAVFEIIGRNTVRSGRARLTFFDERAGGPWTFESVRQTRLLITTADSGALKDDFRLAVSPFPVNSKSPLAGVKSINYLENLLALDKAKQSGFDEAVRLNERGEIVSACLANIFWRRGERLFTPALETGCLAGTTREFIIEEFGCAEVVERLNTLEQADAVFLTSAGIGIAQIAEFAGRKLEKNLDSVIKLFEID